MTETLFRHVPMRVVPFAAGLLLVTLLSAPAHACSPACEEMSGGIALGIGASGMVALLAPIVTRDLVAGDETRRPSNGATAAIAGGAALVSVVVTAAVVAASRDGSGPAIDEGQFVPEVVAWVAPPLIVGMATAIVTDTLMRTSSRRRDVTFTVSPIASGATGVVAYSF